LSPQTLLNCHTDAGDCNGGNSLAAYISVAESDTGITDDTCTPYEGVDYSNWGESDCADRMCKTHDLYGQSYWVNGSRVFVENYGTTDATDLDALMSEVYTNGPIACYMYAHSDSFEDYTGGIITDATQYPGITHVVVLVGWGHDDATNLDYWVVRNSFGTYWGEQGFYRVERGINAFNMETGVCEWATPTQDSVDALIASAAIA
jgi:cathepsin X